MVVELFAHTVGVVKNGPFSPNYSGPIKVNQAVSSFLGFVAQWSECPTGNRKTQVQSPAGLLCVFFRLIRLSVHIFVGKEKDSLI